MRLAGGSAASQHETSRLVADPSNLHPLRLCSEQRTLTPRRPRVESSKRKKYRVPQSVRRAVANQILYAHVCMLSGREGEARAIYYDTRSMRADESRDGRRVILDDFKVFASGGVEHALIVEIEAMLSRRTLAR